MSIHLALLTLQPKMTKRYKRLRTRQKRVSCLIKLLRIIIVTIKIDMIKTNTTIIFKPFYNISLLPPSACN